MGTGARMLNGYSLVNSMGIYEEIAVSDVSDAADVLRPVYDEADGADGFVSIEVDVHAEVPARHVHDAEVAAHRANELCIVSLALDVPVQIEVEVVPTAAGVETAA